MCIVAFAVSEFAVRFSQVTNCSLKEIHFDIHVVSTNHNKKKIKTKFAYR